jgi:nicotinamide-nucleotide amidase
MIPQYLANIAADILTKAIAQQLKIVTAESCTGGLVGGCFTEVPGSSKAYDRGFATYSNEAKRDVLGVPQALLKEHGAVSEPVVRAMATGALEISGADLSVAITGIAGPGGAGPGKPGGLVHFAAARKGGDVVHERHEFGDIGRSIVREKSVETALKLMQTLL